MHSPENSYIRWHSKSDHAFTKESLQLVMQGLPEGILRLKGVVRIFGNDNAHVIQCVGQRCTLKQLEISAPQHSELVAIGLREKVDMDEIETLIGLRGHE